MRVTPRSPSNSFMALPFLKSRGSSNSKMTRDYCSRIVWGWRSFSSGTWNTQRTTRTFAHKTILLFWSTFRKTPSVCPSFGTLLGKMNHFICSFHIIYVVLLPDRTEWQYLVDRFTLNNRYLGRMVNTVASRFTTELRLNEVCDKMLILASACIHVLTLSCTDEGLFCSIPRSRSWSPCPPGSAGKCPEQHSLDCQLQAGFGRLAGEQWLQFVIWFS